MTPEMSSTFVRTQLESSLELLASGAIEQRRFLERQRLAPCVDELALLLEDFVVMAPAAVRDGALSEGQAAAIQQVSDFTGSFSGERNAPLWHVDALDSAWQWVEVRRLAREALQMLRAKADDHMNRH